MSFEAGNMPKASKNETFNGLIEVMREAYKKGLIKKTIGVDGLKIEVNIDKDGDQEGLYELAVHKAT